MFEQLSDISRRLQPTYAAPEARELALWLVQEADQHTWPASRLEDAVSRLLQHEPIQYILGYTDWGGLRLHVTPATLIPRPETYGLVERAAKKFKAQKFRVLDIGTGSGCIALGLKRLCPEWEVMAVDVSAAALEVARQNAESNNLPIRTEQLDILNPGQTDEFIEQFGPFDLVISNPPYIAQSEAATMSPNVLDYEPHAALFVPDDDPLRFYRRIAELGWGRLLAFEINERFGAETTAMLRERGYREIELIHDDYGKDRYVFARHD